jgi:hypothetical protein
MSGAGLRSSSPQRPRTAATSPASPSSPSTPAAGSGPSAPAPAGTGQNSPKAPSPATRGPRAPELPRGPSTKDFLSLRWDYPVYDYVAPPSDSTKEKAPRTSIPFDEAIRFIAGDDPRPLLVLRECSICNKTDRALLSPGIDNERTLLLSRWFHCVKLPVDVSEPQHPFHQLFAAPDSGHLFVSRVDGSGRVPLEADTSRTELWASMTRVLNSAYACDVASVSKDIVRHFDRLDVLDPRARELEKKRDKLMQTPLVDPLDLTKARASLDEVKKAIAAEKAGIERLTRIELRPDVAVAKDR